jgi:hypothetical protein
VYRARHADDARRFVTISGDRGRGPSVRGLAILAISALALIATSPGVPTLEGHVIGEVVIGGGESLERELRIHVDPAAGGATDGRIYLAFQAASGLQPSSTPDVTLAFASASDGGESFEPSSTIPVERCLEGCDLTYRIGLTASPNALPGSVVRYEVDVSLQFSGAYEAREPAHLRVDLDGQATGPVAPVWALLAGVLALLAGIALGPAVDRRLREHRRRWPAMALIALTAALGTWTVVAAATTFVRLGGFDEFSVSPLLVLWIADPWSLGLLGTLAWDLSRGAKRWPVDGGWLLGLSAVGMAGLGGLWLAWRSTSDAVVQPIALTIPFVMLGSLAGVVVGQAWRTDPRADHDRWWAAIAVLSHGVVIAGFGFLAVQSLFEPFPTSPPSLLTLIPAALVAVAFRRWFRGDRAWLILFDVIIAAVGLLGALLISSVPSFGTANPSELDLGDVAVAIAVVAALAAFVTSLHRMPSTSTPRGPVDASLPVPEPATAVSPREPAGDLRATR